MGEGAGFFGEVVEAGSHARSLDMVHDGRVDAAAIDSHLLGVLARDDPARAAGLKVIGVLGPSTIQPVTVAARIDEPVREAIRDALLRAHLDPGCRPALDDGIIERFVASARATTTTSAGWPPPAGSMGSTLSAERHAADPSHPSPCIVTVSACSVTSPQGCSPSSRI